ncbi:MAG: ATP-binding protein [Bacteroidales bacterium]|nr:ATP-binding protein [Bacteroidota bacterium]MBL6949840.1 ATP-binding protein [Bacteroidales bacterium]
MWENIQAKRLLERILPADSYHTLLLLTGARQTGKTSLVRKFYTNLAYYNLDAIEYREQLSSISTFQWGSEVGQAILDEIQKEPNLFDKIKYAFDEGELNFSVLTGSSQILLLKKVRETLAGRITLRELFPFMLCELVDPNGNNNESGMLNDLLTSGSIDDVLGSYPSVVLGQKWDLLKKTENWLLVWGGIPPLIHITSEQNRKHWLADYSHTYLERDLGDLANLNDLKPFRKFQQIAALRSANLLSYTELAKDAGIGIETARRYLEYLNISYQAFLLPPYHTNLTSSLVKTPKLFWFDNGLLRHLSGLGYMVDNGQLYENLIASELMKYIRTTKSETKLSFYRTRSGMEVDFLLETNSGIIAIEAKKREVISSSDFTSLRRLAASSKNLWIGGIVIYRGNKIQQFGDQLWAVPSCRLFS